FCDEAEAIFQGCTGVWWEIGSARLFALWSLYYLGEMAELARRLPPLREDAASRGDNHSATNLRRRTLTWHGLAADGPHRPHRPPPRPPRRAARRPRGVRGRRDGPPRRRPPPPPGRAPGRGGGGAPGGRG